jgi:hypothetical protein
VCHESRQVLEVPPVRVKLCRLAIYGCGNLDVDATRAAERLSAVVPVMRGVDARGSVDRALPLAATIAPAIERWRIP